jgi:hypothetical protein
MSAQVPEKEIPASQGTCSAAVMEAIYGDPDPDKKSATYDASLGNWWKEYASRKNDEEEEHVADSLLYDERCHLPRMAARPDVVPADAVVPNNDGKPVANSSGKQKPAQKYDRTAHFGALSFEER